MANKINTTKSLGEPSQTTIKELEEQIERAKIKFKDDKLVKVRINAQFAKHIGPDLPLGINGVNLVIPVDGKEYEIPETFAKHLNEYLANLTT